MVVILKNTKLKYPNNVNERIPNAKEFEIVAQAYCITTEGGAVKWFDIPEWKLVKIID